MIMEIGNFRGKPIFEKPGKGDIERSVADIKKAKSIRFKPKTDLRRDLEEVFEELEV